MTKELKLTFDSNTIEHLGIKMYSTMPNALAELISNAYDADAKEVLLHLFDDGENKALSVQDNGLGMSFDEVNQNFLKVGRNRREAGAKKTPSGRVATGKKGLGKLALFGLGEVIEIETTKKGSETLLCFKLDWAELKAQEGEYKPTYTEKVCDRNIQGTKITLSKLKRETPFDVQGLAVSLSRLFNYFDKNFKCQLRLNDEKSIQITSKLRYDSIDEEFSWQIPADVDIDLSSLGGSIQGQLISGKTPLSSNLRGITLYAHGRMVNAPSFFDFSESSHVFSYITGWLNVDYIDDIVEEDLISTNRQSLNWEEPEAQKLKEHLRKITRRVIDDWREKRQEKKIELLHERTSIDTEDWFAKLPQGQISSKVQSIVNEVMADPESASDKDIKIVQDVYELLPPYTFYHYRHLHTEVQEVSKSFYERGDYYDAIRVTIIKYVDKVRQATNKYGVDENKLFNQVFGHENGQAKFLKVTANYVQPNGQPFPELTINSIENAQMFLSQGAFSGARNPLAHGLPDALRDSGLLTEKDCLDMLSLMSHLFRRLDDAIKFREAQEVIASE